MNFFAPQIVKQDFFPFIEEILNSSSKGEEVFLVTPFIRFDNKIRDAMRDARNRGARVTLLVRAARKKTTYEDRHFLVDNEIGVYEHESLHAKIYWCKDGVLIGSINLYGTSDRSNLEIGVFLPRRKNIREIRKIIGEWLNKSRPVSHSDLLSKNHLGHCIHCRESIEFDYKRPYCSDCYDEWKKAGQDRQRTEKWCHGCGNPCPATINDALCDTCK